jgi:hypothetical protein
MKRGRKLDCDPDFLKAVGALAENDFAPLAGAILLGHPKNDDERYFLAWYLIYGRNKPRGRPQDPAVVRAAEVYPQVRRTIKELPIRHGRRREAAIAATFSYLRHQGYAAPEREKFENYIRRSKKRRAKKPNSADA